MTERWQYTKGLHDLGNGTWAYLQPDGGWGWSNAGLIIDGEESLLVDTLFDEVLTAEMLTRMQASTGLGAADITTLVNTHANGDHTFGNRLIQNAEIIASAATAEEFSDAPPAVLAGMVARADELGIPAYVRVPVVGAGEDFIGGLAELVEAAGSGGQATTCGRPGGLCPAPFRLCPHDQGA